MKTSSPTTSHERPFEKLFEIARTSLEANIVTTDEGPYLAAGSHQFGSLWTRDFCFAARGLLSIGRDDVVRHHVSHLLRERRADGLIPRVLESVPSWKRVVAHTALRFLPESLKQFPMRAPLKTEHLGEHGTISIDSNALVLRTAGDLVRVAPVDAWLENYRPALQHALEFCLARTNQGTTLVSQGRFEDWQDSVAREGETFFVNALFAEAFASAEPLGLAIPKSALNFQKLLRPAFFDEKTQVYRSHRNLDLVSLDGNLLALNEDALADLSNGENAGAPHSLYSSLRAHPIWTRAKIPGAASAPDYPIEWISWTTKAVGLRHYHDRLLWSWLSGLSAKACLRNGDTEEANRVFTELEHVASRDGAIAEVYEPNSELTAKRTLLYVSEMPFSWGAGCILEALKESQRP